MHNNIQWASYTEEEPDLFCVPHIGQMGPTSVSHRRETSVSNEEEFLI